MSGYYHYTPQVELSRPTVITSYLSDFTRAVTYRASSLLGLRFFDIDRLVEHEAAMEISRLVAESGEAHYREIESRCLERALGEHPAAGRLEKGPWHPLYWETPGAVADLRPYYQARRPAFDEAKMQIPASSLSVAQTCDKLMQHLGA